MFKYDPYGTDMPQGDATRTVTLAGGHKGIALLDRDLCAIIRSCGIEGVASTRAARVRACRLMLIVSAQVGQFGKQGLTYPYVEGVFHVSWSRALPKFQVCSAAALIRDHTHLCSLLPWPPQTPKSHLQVFKILRPTSFPAMILWSTLQLPQATSFWAHMTPPDYTLSPSLGIN